MEDGADMEGPFGLLPNEIVISILSVVSAGALLNCRLICKHWRALIDQKVFREKASRENEIHGLNSFSQIHPSLVKKLRFPWYVFYAICEYDPFNRNLVKNNCGQSELEHWTVYPEPDRSPRIIGSIYYPHRDLISPSLRAIEQTPQCVPRLPDDPDFEGHKSYFTSNSYRQYNKYQNIILKEYGLNRRVIRFLQPDIFVSDWHAAGSECGYEFKATVHKNRDSTYSRLIAKHLLPKPRHYRLFFEDPASLFCKSKWHKVSYVFKNQDNTYSVNVDHEFSGGPRGSKVSGTVVKVLLPINKRRFWSERFVKNNLKTKTLQLSSY